MNVNQKSLNFANYYWAIRYLCTIFLIACSAFQDRAEFNTELGEKVHTEFRTKFSGPTRMIGCQQFNDGSCVYVISEPPSMVDLKSVDKVFDGFAHQTWTCTSPLGYDGYVKDIIVYAYGIPDICQDEIVRDLNSLIYGTDYKAAYTPLPYSGPAPYDTFKPELNVTVNDRTLYDLTLDQGKRFQNVLSGVTLSASQIVDRQEKGIYRGETDDIVLWVLGAKEHINDGGRMFHIFALESDLLLGCVVSLNKQKEGVVMVVGRKRRIDVINLPPLRYDEMLKLAAAGPVLGQSLSMGTPTYCKIDDIYDWCPAWMSPDIRNTEYGHLLTLTDIYLKFWVKGVVYDAKGYKSILPKINFNSALLNPYESITFNWNTRNYLKSTFFNDALVAHFSNIGCLNCMLVDNKSDSEIININVYETFKRIGNPEILRVAQYTMLYGMLQLLSISSELPDSGNFIRIRDDIAYYEGSQKILSRIRDLNDFEIDGIATAIYRNELVPQFSNFSAEDKARFMSDFYHVAEENKKWDEALEKITMERASVLGTTIEQYKAGEEYSRLRHKADSSKIEEACNYFDIAKRDFENDYCINIVSDIEKSREFLRSLSPQQFDNFCRRCASNDDYADTDLEPRSGMYNFERSLKCKFLLSRFSKYFGIDIKELMREYIARVDDERDLWLKTPNVVLTDNRNSRLELNNSFTLRSRYVIGGHSIGTSYQETPPTSVSMGKEILSVTGHPLDDALMYGRKASNANSYEDKMKYFRKSKEALSQNIPRSGQSMSVLYDKLYESIYRSIEEESPYRRLTTSAAVEEIEQIKAIAEKELENDKEMPPQKKEAYHYVIQTAEQNRDVLNAKPKPPMAAGQKRDASSAPPESNEDEEIKELRKRLQRLRMTLAELKAQ